MNVRRWGQLAPRWFWPVRAGVDRHCPRSRFLRKHHAPTERRYRIGCLDFLRIAIVISLDML